MIYRLCKRKTSLFRIFCGFRGEKPCLLTEFGQFVAILRMSLFELLSIPPAFKIDEGLLKKQFLKASRQFHPDFFAHASETEKAAAEQQSSAINQAYQVLKNPQTAMAHLLQLHGLLDDEAAAKLPQDFLMEVMELNELLPDLEPAAFTQKINDFSESILEPVKSIIEQYDPQKTTAEQLQKVRDYYFQQKYLDRILARMQ
jgi:molecular chaperone HscB